MRTCACVPGMCSHMGSHAGSIAVLGSQVQALREASGSGPARTPIRSTLQASLTHPASADVSMDAMCACNTGVPSVHDARMFVFVLLLQRLTSKHCASPCPQGLAVVAREQGMRALFAGLSINYLKVVPSTAIGFTAYDALKQFLDLPQNL